jgi:thioredoxin-like negative regulator of GroEL
METAELLRQALQAARSGRELTARDLFQDVVRIDPDNEIAWMWLSGLLDPLEDRIAACERVLAINPRNQKIRAYRDKLLKEYDAKHRVKIAELDEEVQQVRWYVENGKRDEALLLLQNILSRANGHKEAWSLFADLSVDINDKVRAYEAIVKSDPSDKSARETMKRYRYFQRNPLELATQYEEDGELDKALELYQVLATEAADSPEFERIYKNIVRLEDAKIENVRHVKRAITILRLSAGLPLLYIFEILTQEGLNPIEHPAPDLWFGIPMVVLGSFLVTIAGLRVRHAIWRKWFGERDEKGSNAMRTLVAITGWMLVLAPHLLLVWDSYLRMQNFQTPTIPWIR